MILLESIQLDRTRMELGLEGKVMKVTGEENKQRQE